MAKFTIDTKFLSHTDISDVEDTIVTIKDYSKEVMGQGTQQVEKWVLYFKELKKGLGLNKTNGKILINLFHSDDMDEWIDKKIALYVKDDVEYQGDIVSAIRIRAKAPRPVTNKAALAPPDEEPLSIQEIIYRIDHAESVAEVAALMNQALELDLTAEDLAGIKVVKDQRIKALKEAGKKA